MPQKKIPKTKMELDSMHHSQNGAHIELQISKQPTFEDRKPWHKITISGDPVSCNVPTSFSP